MVYLVKTIMMVVLLAVLGGCTIHFKSKELELDVERQRVESNRTYELEKVDFLVRKNRDW